MFTTTRESISYADNSAHYSAKLSDLGLFGRLMPSIDKNCLVVEKKDAANVYVKVVSAGAECRFSLQRVFDIRREVMKHSIRIVSCEDKINNALAKLNKLFLYDSCYLLPTDICEINIQTSIANTKYEGVRENGKKIDLPAFDNELINSLPNLAKINICGICEISLDPVDKEIDLQITQIRSYENINDYIEIINKISQAFCRIKTLKVAHTENMKTLKNLPANILNIICETGDITEVIRSESDGQ